jgi:hypothetical protein
MSLVAGEIAGDGRPTAGTMAARIFEALEKLTPMGAHEDPRGRSHLAVAIARGVLKYLHDNQASIHVTVPNTGGPGTHQQSPTIDIDIGSGPWP